MREKKYTKSLKKVIRNILKEQKKSNIEEEINIIKSTLVYISNVIIIIRKYDEKNIYDMLKLTENIEEIKYIDKSIKNYNYNKYLNNDYKSEIIEIILDINKEDIKQFSLGELYESFTTNKEKKYLGQVYTPKHIVEDMVSKNINTEDIIENPYFKVIDPACGGGYFLLESYEKIRKIIYENYDKIIMYNKDIQKELDGGVHRFILKNNIWGTDIDEFAVYMTKFSLIMKEDDWALEPNVYIKDLLLSENSNMDKSFDLVLCNPPYIGHKKINLEYRKKLTKKYSDVYSDKSDISYCFFKKGYKLLKNGGRISFITSRYFQESLSGMGLREYITSNFNITRIVDYYGENVFKGIGISAVIIEGTKGSIKNNRITVNKQSQKFKIYQDDLSSNGWILLSKEEKHLFNKIDSSGSIKIGDLVNFNQGIITGCDKAFILTKEEVHEKQIEKDLIKPWIKSSDVYKYKINYTNKYIIYSDNIKQEENYPNAISHIKKYKDRLQKRRECVNGVRKWYELQWGRNEKLFKKEKIVFPYKSDRNRFAISKQEICSSADVYFLTIKDECKNLITLEYLVAFLNSSVFEYYFKCVAKKLNETLYEYYPNKLTDLKVKIKYDFKIDNHDSITDLDNYFFNIYKINDNELNIIKKTVNIEGRNGR